METNVLAPVRPRRTLDEWRELLEHYEYSGQTQEQFCTDHALALSTFGRWRKRLRRQSPMSSGDGLFVELAQDVPASQSWDVELQLGAGMYLRLRRAGC
jgi:hypothetical protein